MDKTQPRDELNPDLRIQGQTQLDWLEFSCAIKPWYPHKSHPFIFPPERELIKGEMQSSWYELMTLFLKK